MQKLDGFWNGGFYKNRYKVQNVCFSDPYTLKDEVILFT